MPISTLNFLKHKSSVLDMDLKYTINSKSHFHYMSVTCYISIFLCLVHGEIQTTDAA